MKKPEIENLVGFVIYSSENSLHYLYHVQDELVAGGEPETRLRCPAEGPGGSLCAGVLRGPLGKFLRL